MSKEGGSEKLQPTRLPLYALRWSAIFDMVVVLSLGLMGGLIGLLVQCGAASECERLQTCERDGVCNFENILTLTTSRIYAPVMSQTWLQTTKGMCAPGEILWPLPTTISCIPRYSYPNAIQPDIIQEAADGEALEPHQAACGRWINAVPSPDTIVYHAFASDEFDAEIGELEEASYSTSSFAADTVAKFFRMCASTVAAGSVAIHAAAKTAYRHLVQSTAFKTLSTVISHGCLAPLEFSYIMVENGLRLVAYGGVTFPTRFFKVALFYVDESSTVRELAVLANEVNRSQDYYGLTNTSEAVVRLLEMGLNRTVDWAPEEEQWLYELGHFLRLEASDEAMAMAYAKGAAAVCAVALGGQVDGSLDGFEANEMRKLTQDRPKGSSLGRVPDDGMYHPTGMMDPEVVRQSMRMNLGALQYSNDESQCTSLTRFIFPDATDETRFDLVVPPTLMSRFNMMVEVLRTSLIQVVTTHPVLSEIYNGTELARRIEQARVMIPGAPLGASHFDEEPEEVVFTHSDGPLLVALKQTHVWWKGQVEVGLSGDAQRLPNTFDSLTTNAYVYPSTYSIWMLLGILRRPFADANYDDESLFSRVGYVVAHEMGHLEYPLERNASVWNELLAEYLPSTHAEARADVLGAAAVVASGYVTKERFCMHLSQLWCARLPEDYVERPSSHPGPNVRGDRLCRVLSKLM
jgi:hypothetical protein